MKNLIIGTFVTALTMGCGSNKSTTTDKIEERAPRQEQRQGRPSIDGIFKMDADGDGKLSKMEVTGRLLNDFSKIDADSDGYITRTEFENAPKPQRGQRPPKN